MIITTIMARLRDHAMPPFKSVNGAEDLKALAAGTASAHGAAFVLPYEERAEENALASGGFRQRVSVQFLVAVVIRKVDDAKGASRVQAVDEFQAGFEAALAGWSWNDDALPCELVVTRAAPAGNGVTLYVQTWRTDRWIEA